MSVGVMHGGMNRVVVEHRAGVRVHGYVLADGGGVDSGVNFVTAVATSTTRSVVVRVPSERPSVALS